MVLQKVKQEFIDVWATMGPQWGISKTMAQIHALLMITPQAMCTEEVKNALQISQGNANINLRNLLDWGIVTKTIKRGDRKEYYTAENDPWFMAQQIAKERKRRELDPLLHLLNKIEKTPLGESPEELYFKQNTKKLKSFAIQTSGLIDSILSKKHAWFKRLVIKLNS